MPSNPTAPPAVVPRWAELNDNGGTSGYGTPASNVVTPPSGNSDTGFADGTYPPAGWWNWFAMWTCNWILWLKSLTAQALIWTGFNEFTAGVQIAGGLKLYEGLASPDATNLAASGSPSYNLIANQLLYFVNGTGTLDVQLPATPAVGTQITFFNITGSNITFNVQGGASPGSDEVNNVSGGVTLTLPSLGKMTAYYQKRASSLDFWYVG